MIRNATVNIYDVMDQIWIAAIITTREANGEDYDSDTETAYLQVRSTGQDTAGKWLREALEELIEAL